MSLDKNTNFHIPVLVEEVIQNLELKNDDVVLDGTIGFGGHAEYILKKIPQGKYIGIDQDHEAITYCQKKFEEKENIWLFNIRYDDFEIALDNLKVKKIDKVLLDLGMSSYQLDQAQRGFSFQKEEPLLLQMNLNNELSAKEVLNTYTTEDLIHIFTEYGEIFRPEKFVEKIVALRQDKPFETTSDLLFAIKKGFYFHNKRFLYIKTASQVFQALRIEVNQEYLALNNFLKKILEKMSKNGRIAIITFNSIEDKIIKKFGNDKQDLVRQVNKKVLKAGKYELRRNLRAKPAKLRIFEKII
jgi:16S rRNA (cytosine1402-N4)-methyltransferase